MILKRLPISILKLLNQSVKIHVYMGLFDKIQEIVTAYSTMMNPTEEQKEVAARRLQICMTCEAWRNVPVDHCSKCGCATKAKVFTPKGQEACPMGKWTI